ncbi:YggS family pyridoxal phosphate-dependent enzyme [Qiania dongpingensis]|uniref:Pyridoxal phosphate homeostasis protein n=1 Tax=Qiania dongpingensis TaxID=2763669 RepID=A0A7G9G3Z3_9FIRM|nr:YggS family pyridoxal phosphate-dependent enzyme [Qiania dongpingensis]QNM05525.1 YggS family pyridoxal phosphate-dependent enzyme [Qiania dongpingensis]
MLKDNLEAVEKRVLAACERAGRSRESVRLIAVSKTKPVEMLEEIMNCGVKDFGENKVQEMCSKTEEITEPLRWHLIGHLQRNKVKYIVDKAYMIHSVDSVRLAREIQKEAEKHRVVCQVLIEVNIGGEETKDGVPKEEAAALIREIAAFPNVRVKGLMTIAPPVEDPEEARGYFKEMRALFETIKAEKIPGVEMEELSMGMTGDFEVAIEEGATMIRVGTAIFGARQYGAPESADTP